MNYESKKIFVDDIYVNNTGYEFLATVKHFSSLRKWIAIGESMQSDEFCLIFPDSIGESKWKLLFYPNGQYADGVASHHVGIYLVLLDCENIDSALKAKTTFRLKPQKQTEHEGFIVRLNTKFSCSIPSNRWIGKPDFVGKNWLNSKRCKDFIDKDQLIISCVIEEVYGEKDPNINETISVKSDVSTNDQSRTVLLEEKASEIRKTNESGWTIIANKRGKGNHDNRNTERNNGAPKDKSSVYAIMLSICIL